MYKENNQEGKNINNNTFSLGSRVIGDKYKPLIIAEIGINHGGDLDLAKQFVELIAEAGGECAKFQIHVPEEEMSLEAKNIIPPNTNNKSIYSLIEECSFTPDQDYELKEFCESLGLIYLATAFSRKAADQLYEMNVDAIKVGSGECNHLPLIEHISKFNIPMIVSTGMNSIDSVKETENIISKYNTSYAFLHCTNRYPTEPEWVNLSGITEMKEKFNCTIGFSDHSIGSEIALSSVALGANIIERHFTDDKNRDGADISCSMDKKELCWLISQSENVWKAIGEGKKPHSSEQTTIDFAFASLVAEEKIDIGEVLTSKNVWAKRPNTGISVSKYNEIISNYYADVVIEKNEQITFSKIKKL